MKIALAQLDFHVGNFEANTQKIIDAITNAKAAEVDLIVFPELAVCGYPPWDFLEFKHFIKQCEEKVLEIAKHCVGIAAIVGAPSINPLKDGKDLYNSAFFLEGGTVKSITHKTLLPTYDVFDEYRYFEPNSNFKCIEFKGQKIALTICEDLWNLDDNPLYTINPMDELIKEKPAFAINIAASPFSYDHDKNRTLVLQRNAAKYGIPFYYVNHTGAQTELIFDGASTIASPDGRVYKMPLFTEVVEIFSAENLNLSPYSPPEKYAMIHLALVEGIKDYFNKLGFKKAVLGLSGGMDSALVYALAVGALGAENVLPVLMPSQYTSDDSNKDALQMVKLLGTAHKIIPISAITTAYDGIFAEEFKSLPKDITEENIQSRTRGTILMALANKFGMILLNTSNKSEFAVGYSTLYGDSNGGISVLGDIYKTEVYELARQVNKVMGDVIPENIFAKEPSAELRPDQKDTDSLPPYAVLDTILFLYIEKRLSPIEIIAKGYEEKLVLRVLKLVNQSEYKRFQAPPILRVSEKAFGVGRRLPIVAKYLS